MAKFSKERLEGKALEDAFKLLAQRRKASLKKDLKEGITIPLSKLEPKIGAVKIKKPGSSPWQHLKEASPCSRLRAPLNALVSHK